MKFQLGKWYYIVFRDHVKDDGGDEFTLEICGQVIEEDKHYIRIIYWKSISKSGDTKSEEGNNETARIVKAAITKKKKLPI